MFTKPQLHHPSALRTFEQITNASEGKQIVMFLDYDGTLSPIVEDPDQAFMSKEVNLLLCTLLFNFFLYMFINYISQSSSKARFSKIRCEPP